MPHLIDKADRSRLQEAPSLPTERGEDWGRSAPSIRLFVLGLVAALILAACGVAFRAWILAQLAPLWRE